MEENNQTQLSLIVDDALRYQLQGAAKWAKILAIIGFVVVGIIVLFAIFFRSLFRLLPGAADMPEMQAMASMLIVPYLILAFIYFLPVLFLYRFAHRTQNALGELDQDQLSDGIGQLRRFFTFIGIISLIGIIIMALSVGTSLIAGMAML